MPGITKLDTKQIAFLRFYEDPKSETFGNALQSALRAGFKESYARTITAKQAEWVDEALRRRERILNKAERNLEEYVDMNTSKNVLDKQGNVMWSERDASLETTKAKVTMFVAETVGKKFYSKANGLNVGVQINFGSDKDEFK